MAAKGGHLSCNQNLIVIFQMRTKRPDNDMVRTSALLSKARSIASRRRWLILERGLDAVLSAILRITPGGGERPKLVEFHPVERGIEGEIKARETLERRHRWIGRKRTNKGQ